MSFQYKVGKIDATARMPSLGELTTTIEGLKSAATHHAPLRDLCKAVLPAETYETLSKQKPGCFKDLGDQILQDTGFGADVTLLEEHELDAEFASAYHTADVAARKLYPDPDDDQGRVFPIVYPVAGEERRCILRFPKEREIETLRKAGTTFAAYKRFVVTTCVHGDMETLEREAPGMYPVLGEFLVKLAGSGDVVRVGKS